MAPTASQPATGAIMRALSEIEDECGVAVLYACESGSRAWGFESTNSDWDVRFLFCYAADVYLAIDASAEQIERHIESVFGPLDIVGWDLRKTLRLLRKSNPSLLEWLHSPIQYVAREPATSRLRGLMARAFSRARGAYHYARMARSNDAAVLRSDPVIRKRYFYMLRTTLAHQWIVERGTIPPVLFEELLDALVHAESAVYGEVRELLQRKRAGMELGAGPKLPHLDAYLREAERRMEATLQEIEHADEVASDQPTTLELDEFFRDVIRDNHASGSAV